MPRTRLEFVNVTSLDDLLDQVEGQLELTVPLARSAEAVYDVLSSEVDGSVEVVWHESGFSRVAMGDRYQAVLDVFHTLAAERSDFDLTLD